jgi:hypothetical protein
MKLTLLYRGPLSSCNYGCHYCPFAKRVEDRAALANDQAALERFLAWVESRREDQLRIFFTPWGEALVRRWYRNAIVHITRLSNVERVVAQTNLSAPLGWVERCVKAKLALWCTYHPTQVSHSRFLAQCHALDEFGVRFSVGAVGLREQEAAVAQLRAELPPHVYFWVNAFKGRPDYYTEEEIHRFTDLDPLFPLNLANHVSRSHSCRAGESVISVDGDGVIRRCHFLSQPIGHLYKGGGVEAALAPRPCPRSVCSCHIGYVHLRPLGLERVFGDGALERIPLAVPRPLAHS